MSFKMLRWIPVFALVVACVDPVLIDADLPPTVIVVDGSITDQPGPYTVKLTHAFAVNADSTKNTPIAGAKIVLYSDKGESEDLVEEKPGVYHTGGAIHGTVGNTYHITVQLSDGSMFESEPERLNPAGTIRAINYEYEHRTTTKIYGVVTADAFNIYVDAEGEGTEDELTYMRWRFSGTYKTETNPELHVTSSQGFTYMTPFECSGYVVDPAPGGGILRQDTVCTCCTCWVQQFETIPRVASSEIVTAGQFRNVKVADVPITHSTFFEKYYVELEQMSISKNAYEFFNITQSQKENVTNLFQPPPGRHVGNINVVNGSHQVIGLFWAAAITHGSIFIPKSAVPYKMPKDIIPLPCTYYANSSTTKPPFWDE